MSDQADNEHVDGSARIRPALAAFDAARSPAWLYCLPPPHWARAWHPCDSRTLMHLLAIGRLGRYFDDAAGAPASLPMGVG